MHDLQMPMSFLQWLCVPFTLMYPHSADITKTAFNFTYQAPWVGTIEKETMWKWIDNFLLLVRTICVLYLIRMSAHVNNSYSVYLSLCNDSQKVDCENRLQ